MKKWSYLFMTMGIAMAFSACSDEIDLSTNNGGSTEESTSQVFMQFNLELPAVSRSTTQIGGGSDAGVEIGKDYENQVSEVLVVITDATEGSTYDKFIAKSSVVTPSSANNTTYVVPFKTTELTSSAGKSVNVYVYCNPTEELTKATTFDVNKDYYTLTDATNATIWTKNKFLMTNADEDYERTLPTNLDDYRVETNPFDLETIKVERAAARFDYKSSVANETYTLMEEDGKAEVTVTLTDMALVNLSKEFYYLRRVSADGTSTNATIGGTETNTNYVVDTDYEWKGKYSEETTDKASHFFYVYNPNSASTTDYAWTSISSLTSEDNDESWNSGENANDNRKGYKIWRYATENTIPAQVSNQKKGITTGVVFKGEIKGVSDGMKTLLNGTNTVYVFDNILWGTWDNVKTAAEVTESGKTTLANPLLAAAYNEAMKGGYSDPKAVAAGFTIFRPNTTTQKYEVLYYYWNRHNDNNNNGSMGPMEFAVVRNNVYKLSVTGVDKFGHPTDPDDDPDPENPEDPDEEDDVYFKVAVEVLPWVVRINDIEF